MALAIILVISLFFSQAQLPASKKVELPTQNITYQEIHLLFQNGTLPSYTETLTGTTQEPIKLIIIAPADCFIPDITRAGWTLAESVSIHSTKNLGIAALLNKEYPTAPMTPSFYNSQPNGSGFEKETDRKTARSRHHARFWKTKYVTPNGELYVGTISLDIGLKWGITHTIAPDIDTERDLFIQYLKNSKVIKEESLKPFIPPTLSQNFAGDPFFTDGKTEYINLDRCKK